MMMEISLTKLAYNKDAQWTNISMVDDQYKGIHGDDNEDIQ